MTVADADDPTVIDLYIPADPDSWVSRFENACSLLEQHAALPRVPLKLGYFAGEDTEREVEDRLAFLNQTLADPYRQVIVSNGRRLRYTRTGSPLDEGKVLVKANFTRPGQSGIDVSIHFPAVPWDVRVELFGSLGDILQAHTGHFTPIRATRTLNDINARAAWPEGAPGRARLRETLREIDAILEERNLVLPAIKRACVGGVRQDELQPEQLGWVNYWSSEAAAYLGFPQESLDAELLSRSTRTGAGAWLTKVTLDPMDLTRADHVVALAQMYLRFPRAGIRY